MDCLALSLVNLKQVEGADLTSTSSNDFLPLSKMEASAKILLKDLLII
jgi:hypothetical protein